MPKQSNHGFTLIEVIIALSIFAVLSIIGYKGISSLLQTKERIEIEDGKWQQLIWFFDRFELDVKQSANRPIKTRDGSLEPAWQGQPYFSGKDGAQLVFSRFGDPMQSGFLMDTRRIGYRLSNNTVELLIWPSLDAAPSAKPEVFKVMPHVLQIAFSYLSESGAWLNTWPETISLPKSFAPSAVKLTVKLQSGESISRVFAL